MFKSVPIILAGALLVNAVALPEPSETIIIGGHLAARSDIPANLTADNAKPSPTTHTRAELLEIQQNQVKIIQRSPEEYLDLQPIGAEAESEAHVQKRVVLIHLKKDTGAAYRVVYKGLSLVMHIFFDLAVNHAVFYWTIDGSNPAPGTLNIRFKDASTGVGFPAQEYTHDTRYNLGGFLPDDLINVVLA